MLTANTDKFRHSRDAVQLRRTVSSLRSSTRGGECAGVRRSSAAISLLLRAVIPLVRHLKDADGGGPIPSLVTIYNQQLTRY
jgi:hypothetical protein